MAGILLIVAPACVAIAVVALMACVDARPRQLPLYVPGFALLATAAALAAALGEDEDPSFPGQSRWDYHVGSHSSFTVLISLLVLALLASLVSRVARPARWAVPPALLLASPACLWVVANVLH
jgi:hypothetical protein